METIQIGRQVSLRTAPEKPGTVVDYELVEDDGMRTRSQYLVEWEDLTTSWHRWAELEPTVFPLSEQQQSELRVTLDE